MDPTLVTQVYASQETRHEKFRAEQLRAPKVLKFLKNIQIKCEEQV